MQFSAKYAALEHQKRMWMRQLGFQQSPDTEYHRIDLRICIPDIDVFKQKDIRSLKRHIAKQIRTCIFTRPKDEDDGYN